MRGTSLPRHSFAPGYPLSPHYVCRYVCIYVCISHGALPRISPPPPAAAIVLCTLDRCRCVCVRVCVYQSRSSSPFFTFGLAAPGLTYLPIYQFLSHVRSHSLLDLSAPRSRGEASRRGVGIVKCKYRLASLLSSSLLLVAVLRPPSSILCSYLDRTNRTAGDGRSRGNGRFLLPSTAF